MRVNNPFFIDLYSTSSLSERASLMGKEILDSLKGKGENVIDRFITTVNWKSPTANANFSNQGFRILLSHDPSHWTAEVIPNTDIPLTLSGHTHSAQIKIFGWTPAKWSFKETAGRYDRDGQTLYINVGLGCTAPIRLGVNPEVTVITLKK